MNAAFLKLQRGKSISVCVCVFALVCMKAISLFTTQHVWHVWLVVFTPGYP